MKKAIAALRISNEGQVIWNPYGLRQYPRTKWIARSERHFRRVWREKEAKNKRLERLDAELERLEAKVEFLEKMNSELNLLYEKK